MFFQTEVGDFCIYTTLPHDLMSVDFSRTEKIQCNPLVTTEANEAYSKIYGELRGGAQPIRIGDRFLCIAHSSYKLADNKSRYACVAYEFSATFPFQILRISRRPIPLPGRELLEDSGKIKLNPNAESVVYPCGAVLDGEDILVSYGIDDESAAIFRVPLSRVMSELQIVETTRQVSMRPAVGSAATLVETIEPRLALYWWDSRGKSFDHPLGTRKFRVGNFGDIASRDIVEGIIAQPTRSAGALQSPKLLAVGSILHNANDGDVIWGSGAKGTKRILPERIKTLDVRAVRGPLTAEILRSHKIDLSQLTHVFDPGCLIQHLWKSQLDSYDVSQNDFCGSIRIVPHYKDDLSIRRLHPEMADSILSVDDTPLGLAQKMLGAEVIVSSSLHGIIFAEALGIPAYWLNPLGGEDHFKYYDYYYGTGRYNVAPFDSVTDALAAKPQPLPTFDVQAYLDTFPFDRIESLSTSVRPSSMTFNLAGRLRSEIDSSLYVDWANAVQRSNGVYAKGEISTFGVYLTDRNWQPSVLRLTLGRNPEYLEPVHITINTPGDVCYLIEWSSSNFDDQVVEVFLPAELVGHQVKFKIQAGDGLSLAEKMVVTEVAVVPLTDFELSGFGPKGVGSDKGLEPAIAMFDEFPTEWVLNLESLIGKRGFSYKFGDRYALIRNTARLHLNRKVIEGAHTLFLTGPHNPSTQSVSRIAMHFGQAVFAGDIQVDASRNQWMAKIVIDSDLLAPAETFEVVVELIEGATDNTAIRRRGKALIFRKCALAKRQSDFSVP